MRTFVLALIGAGLAAAMTAAAPAPAKAESDPTLQNYAGTPQFGWRGHPSRRFGQWRGGYDGAPGGSGYGYDDDYGYVDAPWPTWNGCPPHYTVQDGVCKPYRGY